uniref:Uncharacterized protein n=1 Tax=Plectus sambesii TaxID=2011161 RepID=A0A914UV64_9BILA
MGLRAKPRDSCCVDVSKCHRRQQGARRLAETPLTQPRPRSTSLCGAKHYRSGVLEQTSCFASAVSLASSIVWARCERTESRLRMVCLRKERKEENCRLSRFPPPRARHTNVRYRRVRMYIHHPPLPILSFSQAA